MSTWAALNVEPDEAIEEEVDDTKEIQIEEALKLYQNALKLHSQGPQFYSQAAEAYEELLNSEIFKYPESVSEYKRAALQDSEIQFGAAAGDVAGISAQVALAEFDINDSTSGTLQQTIFLSYKNHGQYTLDALRSVLHDTFQASEISSELSAKITESSRAALTSFAEALERDDTDLNLWRQSARLSSALHSYRLARYCLESVLADDENRLEVRTEQLGLEETLAEERLRETLLSVQDNLSVCQVPLKKPKKALLKFLQRQIDPYPYLPSLPKDLRDTEPSKTPLSLRASRYEIKVDAPTWAATGKAILQLFTDEEGAPEVGPGTSITISLPADSPEMKSIATLDYGQSSKMQIDGNQHQDTNMAVNNSHDSGAQSTAIKSQGPESVAEHADDQSSIDQRAEKQLMESLEVQSSQPPQTNEQQESTNLDEVEAKSPVNSCRKRSSASAVTEDQAERLRAKSRRTRLRDSIAEASAQTEEIPFDHTKYYEDLLEPYIQADEWVFKTVGSFLSKIGIEELGTMDNLRRQVAPTDEKKDSPDTPTYSADEVDYVLPQDLKNIMKQWDEGKSQAMLQSDNFSALQDIQGMGKSGMAIFLDHSRKSARKLGVKQTLSGEEHLFAYLRNVNHGWFHAGEVAFDWLKSLLIPNFGVLPPDSNWSASKSAYVAYQWPATLKETILQLLLQEDEYFYNRLSELVESVEQQILQHQHGPSFKYTAEHYADVEMIQAIFELHLEIFAPINSPNSDADDQIRTLQQDRLTRWCLLARTALTHLIAHCPAETNLESMTLRHAWASAFHSNMAGDVQREHILLCLQELKHFLHHLGTPVISLVNNTLMSELSSEAIDQEISKLNSMDFFLKIFNPESDDPVGLIETIEPIVEPTSIQNPDANLDNEQSLQLREMGSFLDRGDATLRLFLWRRLQEAYKNIEYPPKVVSCYFRSIETIIKELRSSAHLEEPSEVRHISLIRWLKSLDGLLNKTAAIVLQEADRAYECFDMEHVNSSMTAVTLLIKLLHGFMIHEDAIRVGQISGSDLRGTLAKSLESFKDKMREMLVRCWILLYTLFKEAISQNAEIFDTPLEDRIYFLRCVHNALGIRKMCRRSHKQFLKLMKSELFTLDVKQDTEADICQLLFDIHGVKLSSSEEGLPIDHGCQSEKLDRTTAIMMIDFVMKQAKKMNIKDLSKSELKTTIDKMQQAIGTTKASPPLSYNRRILSAYLKSSLNPTELFRAVRGVADLPLIPVPTESAKIAKNGWYFLLGHAALTKFRSQKRLNPVPTTDLDDAITWFRQDLEHGTSRWETWYRLAQTYDSKLEEDITWSADKINNNRMELVTWQRNAIHCYAMATATAIKYAEPTAESRALLADLYTDFGIRLYSSSREPLSMGAFSVADFTRHYSSEESQQMYEGQPFKEMKVYSVWNLASYLLRRAIVDKPKSWVTHYMLSKCLWKMFSCDESVRGNAKRISVDSVLDSLLDTIDALPQRKDSRADPIFEPHYKLVSVVHKLVQREVLTPADASKTLHATPRARKVQPPENTKDWKRYILEVLRNLKNADKSNWHHRMAVRAAHVIYDENKDASAAAGAKSELTQQIFTKTMTIQVWRPEFERPGRHFVYTTRYAYFFVALLDQLDDRANLDQLLRRVRKKQGDFINHSKLWEDMCLTYARVIRRAGHITEGHEEGVFRPIGWEEFVANTARLEALPQLAPGSSSLLELLRDAIELKKLNNNLMKVSLLEDLIADLYSRLYEVNMPQVIEQVNEENKEKMRVDHLLMANDGAADVSTPPTSAPTSEAPAPRGRTKGIARRDIQKRAETIVTRKVAPRVPTTRAPTATETEPTATTSESATADATSIPKLAAECIRDSAAAGAAEDIGSAAQSDIPNSLHDSADDESELSEIDDEKLSRLTEDRKLLFPNLGDRASVDPESELSAQLSVDGEGANEAQGEMEIEVEEDGDREGEGDLGEGEGETMGEEGEEPGDDDIEMEGEEEDGAGGEEEEEEEEVAGEEGEDDGEGSPPDYDGEEEPEEHQGTGAEQENENLYESEAVEL